MPHEAVLCKMNNIPLVISDPFLPFFVFGFSCFDCGGREKGAANNENEANHLAGGSVCGRSGF
jgi:hypothetical protein